MLKREERRQSATPEKEAMTLTEYPEWVEAKGKIDQLQADLRALHERETLLREAKRDNHVVSVAARAESLLRGESPDYESVATELERLSERSKVIKIAIDMQTHSLQEIKGRLSKEICDNLRPKYTAIVASMTDALKSLRDAMEKEKAIRESLIKEDVSFIGNLPPAIFMPFIDNGDLVSHINRFLANAKNNSYI